MLWENQTITNLVMQSEVKVFMVVHGALKGAAGGRGVHLIFYPTPNREDSGE